MTNLIQKIGKKLILPLAVMGIVGQGCNTVLKVGDSEVKYGYSWDFSERIIRETKKDGTIVEYFDRKWAGIPSEKTRLGFYRLKINGVGYYPKDDSVFTLADKRVHFLIDRFYFVEDSTKQAYDSARQAEGLKALE